jgi:transcriptional regulator with XRE-family HTH domain
MLHKQEARMSAERDKERIAASVRHLRRRAGLTQSELAEKAAISRATLARIEAERVDPAASTLRRLADALGVTVNDLFGEED